MRIAPCRAIYRSSENSIDLRKLTASRP
jgi:hypothetical protein